MLGKRLGKAMGAVGKAIQSMTAADVAEYESAGSVTLAGQQLQSGDLKVSGKKKTSSNLPAYLCYCCMHYVAWLCT